jgi:hypothetical protein
VGLVGNALRMTININIPSYRKKMYINIEPADTTRICLFVPIIDMHSVSIAHIVVKEKIVKKMDD